MKVETNEIERRVEYFKSKAREAGVRLTHQRLEIFREIASRLDHPDAESIYAAIQSRMPGVSLETVSHTLWILYDLNLIATYGQLRETIHFDPNPSPHHHYICVRCGIIRDLSTPEFDDFQLPAIAGAYGSVLAMRVELAGLCEACSRAGKMTLAN